MPLFFRRRNSRHQMLERKSTEPRMEAIIAGRRHLTGVPYALPKDTSEINRLDFQHYIYRRVVRGNFLVPLDDPRMILDVGCGTGIWCHEMAQQFPAAQVVGLDLEQIKKSGGLPTMYQFVQGNILAGLPFEENTFDFVHQRLILASAIPVARWIEVFKELLRVARPGGWLELPEVGVEVQQIGPLTRQFFAWGISASEARGLDPRQIPHVCHYLTEAGGRNAGVWFVDVPMGAWAGRIGVMMQKNLSDALAGLQALYCERGATAEDFNALLKQLPEEWSACRSRMRFFIFYCQK